MKSPSFSKITSYYKTGKEKKKKFWTVAILQTRLHEARPGIDKGEKMHFGKKHFFSAGRLSPEFF